ncbi:MAG: alpha-glycosidase [Lachnospiraceae bacterium]|nr:alpha-glycosidase [Lachnospiraceae bacterium]
MEQWLESVYSDGTDAFVSNPEPELFEKVKISIRMYDDAPVKHVLLRSIPNGAELLIHMQEEKKENGLVYYAAELKITENRMQYQFYLVCEDIIYYYTQNGITTYIPDHTYDFVLLADYRQPKWVKGSVFYQIFPERFCNGDTANDVQNGEYSLNGHETIHMNWEDRPLQYEQGFCMDFFGGDLEGIRKKIPYLKKLGVTALYLNPIFRAPSVHKYDCIDYFHVDEHFGGDEALALLSKELHENDMKLILDISINHTGTAHRWFNRDGLYFDKSEGAYNNPDSKERGYYFFEEGSNRYHGWFNIADLPTLNYTSEALRDIIYRSQESVLKKWLKQPYNIDGWRFDVADVFARNNEVQLAHELWPQIRKSIREENPQAYILAEDWGDCAGYMQGQEWDSPMNYYGCGRVIRQFLGEPDLFNARNEFLRDVKYKMTAEDFVGRVTEHLSKLPYVMWENQFNLIDSHDVPRLHNNAAVNSEEYRGAVMLQFMLVGAPSVYYGDEAEIDGWTENNEGCRFPMPWGKNIEECEAYHLYSKLAHLKTESMALSKGGMKFLYAKDYILSLARFYGNEAYISVVSANPSDKEIELPVGIIGAAADAGFEEISGRAFEYEKKDNRTIKVNVKAHCAYLLKLR